MSVQRGANSLGGFFGKAFAHGFEATAYDAVVSVSLRLGRIHNRRLETAMRAHRVADNFVSSHIRTPCVAQRLMRVKTPVAALVGKASPQQVAWMPRPKRGVQGTTPQAVGGEKPLGLGVRWRRHWLTGRLSAACLPLLLAACATPTVTRSCLTQQQYEQLKAAEPPRIHDRLTGHADEDTRPLAGSALELRSWGHAMLDTLKICSTP